MIDGNYYGLGCDPSTVDEEPTEKTERVKKHRGAGFYLIVGCLISFFTATIFIASVVFLIKEAGVDLYSKGIALTEQGKWEEAMEMLSSAGRENSAEYKICQDNLTYEKAVRYSEAGIYEKSVGLFRKIPNFKDSDERAVKDEKKLMTDIIHELEKAEDVGEKEQILDPIIENYGKEVSDV